MNNRGLNNKGFTLIEVLIVFALLATASIIIGVNMVGLSNKQNIKEYERVVKDIETAARTYVGLDEGGIKEIIKANGSGFVSVGDLIKDGYVDKDVEDARTGKPIDKTNEVKVTYENNEFTYCYEEYCE